VKDVIYANQSRMVLRTPALVRDTGAPSCMEINVIYAGVVIYGSRLDHLGIGVVIKPGHIRGPALADAAAVERALVGDLAGVE
jgi:hypothetical protein